MANVTLKAKLVLRNDTESNWIKANPVLIKGEMGYCTDKQYLKIGDGTKVFTMLPKNTLGKVILLMIPQLMKTRKNGNREQSSCTL